MYELEKKCKEETELDCGRVKGVMREVLDKLMMSFLTRTFNKFLKNLF